MSVRFCDPMITDVVGGVIILNLKLFRVELKWFRLNEERKKLLREVAGSAEVVNLTEEWFEREKEEEDDSIDFRGATEPGRTVTGPPQASGL